MNFQKHTKTNGNISELLEECGCAGVVWQVRRHQTPSVLGMHLNMMVFREAEVTLPMGPFVFAAVLAKVSAYDDCLWDVMISL